MVRDDWSHEKIHFVTGTRDQLPSSARGPSAPHRGAAPPGEPSAPFELMLSVSREAPGTLGAQIESQLRRAIRGGELHGGVRIPSTRDLARQLGVSRRIAVDAYAQLAAEGYLVLRQGAQPRVAEGAAADATSDAPALWPQPVARYDFRPSRPDVSAFPRTRPR